MPKKKFLPRLRTIREYLGMNINQLSLLTGIRPDRLSKIERQLCRAKPDEIQKIVLALSINEELLTGEKTDAQLLNTLFRQMKPGEKIKFLRCRLGLSQQRLADKVGITRPYLSYLENGIIPVPTHLKEKIARALGVTPDEIWHDEKQ